MQNLLAVIPGLPVGGAERMLVNLVNRLDRERISTVVVSLNDHNPLAAEIEPVAAQVIACPRRWRYDLGPAKRIRRMMEALSIDTVLCFGLYAFFFVRVACLGLARPRVCISVHNSQLRSRKQLLLHWAYARLLTGREHLISVCNTQARDYAKAYAIPLERFTTIYNGVDTDEFAPSGDPTVRASMRARFRVPPDAPLIVQVASFHPNKGHEDAIGALRYLMNANPRLDPYLLIVGGGFPDRQAKIREMATHAGLGDRVVFCGIQGDVRPFYEMADVFTLTSRWRETFSVAALEAMSMGLPCVLTGVGGAREMIEEGFNGYIVQPDNHQSIADGWQRALVGLDEFSPEAIRANVVRRFSLQKCVRRYEALLSPRPPDGAMSGC